MKLAKFGTMALAVALTMSGAAQAPQSQQGPEPAVPENNHAPIKLHVVVTPNSGHPVEGGLPQSAFTLLDNGQPRAIDSFRAVSGKQEPVKVIVVLDAVNIGYTQLSYARQQVEAFLRANEGQLSMPTTLAIVTDTKTEMIPGFSTDGNLLAQKLDSQEIGLRDLRRSSGFYGAEERLELSLTDFRGLVARAGAIPGRKAILWVSPGWPLLSGPAVQLSGKQTEQVFNNVVALSAAIRQANVTVYDVNPLGSGENLLRSTYYESFEKGLRKPSDAAPGDLGLQVLAVQSGGLVLTNDNDVKAMLQRCVEDTTAFYELQFTPTPADRPNQYHQVEVRVAEPKTVARALQGYYAQP